MVNEVLPPVGEDADGSYHWISVVVSNKKLLLMQWCRKNRSRDDCWKCIEDLDYMTPYGAFNLGYRYYKPCPIPNLNQPEVEKSDLSSSRKDATHAVIKALIPYRRLLVDMNDLVKLTESWRAVEAALDALTLLNVDV